MPETRGKPCRTNGLLTRACRSWARAVSLVLLGGLTAWGSPLFAAEKGLATIMVYKTPHCRCCVEWVEHLRGSGLEVSVRNVDSTRAIQSRLGVPEPLRSCHTAAVGNYWVEGHVPADLVGWLLRESPEGLRGLAVPGMPIGSPGMEGTNPVRYPVVQVNTSGESSVLEIRKGHAHPQ